MTNGTAKKAESKTAAEDPGRTLCLTDGSGGRLRVASKDLFADGHREICIEHEGAEYRLRVTRQNKLILYR